MLFAFTLGWCLVVVAALHVVTAFRLDRELRRLMPPAAEHRLRRQLLQDLRSTADWLDASLRALETGMIPPRWRREYFHVYGAAAVDRFWTAAVRAIVFLAAGIGVIGLAGASAGF